MPERIGYQRACARAAARPDRDIVLFRPVNEIGNNQEVTRESHGIDHAQFEIQARRVFLFRVLERCSVLLPAGSFRPASDSWRRKVSTSS